MARSDSSSAAERESARSPEEIALSRYHRPRHALIAEAAYYRSLRRERAERDPVADWLAAEAEIDRLLARVAREGHGDAGGAASDDRSHR